MRRAPIRAISSSSKSCSPASLPAPLSTTFNIGGVSFHPAPTGVRVAYAQGYAAFFIAAPDPQLSAITRRLRRAVDQLQETRAKLDLKFRADSRQERHNDMRKGKARFAMTPPRVPATLAGASRRSGASTFAVARAAPRRTDRKGVG